VKSLKEKFPKEELGGKFEALFNQITPLEILLMSFPLIISISTSQRWGLNSFTLALLGLMILLIFGILYLSGVKWRIIYFITLLVFAIYFNYIIGWPWRYVEGADRDDAIRIGVEAILNGTFPYYERTPLGHTPTPLPFTFILYLPIYLLTGGYVTYMNIYIIIIFCTFVYYAFLDTTKEYLILPMISFIILADWYFLEITIASDLVNSGLLLCMITLLIPDEIPEQKKFLKVINIIPQEPKSLDNKVIVFAILFGCLLATRVLIWIVGLIVLLYIFKIYGFKNTIVLGLITISVFLMIMLPFMLWDFDYFFNVCPLGQNSNKFISWRDSIPNDGTFLYNIGDFFHNLISTIFNYGSLNGILVTGFILSISLILGILKLENKFHLFLIIAISYGIFLFFFNFTTQYAILRDYVSIGAIPLVFSLSYIELPRLDDSKKRLYERLKAKIIKKCATP